jgi:hypothetical protein
MVFVQHEGPSDYTDFRPSCYREEELKCKYNIQNNYEYKLFLQRNAKMILDDERKKLRQSSIICDCDKCNQTSTIKTLSPKIIYKM